MSETIRRPPTDEWADELIESAHDGGRYRTVLVPLRYVSKGENPPAQSYFNALRRRADVRVIAFREDQPHWVREQVFTIDTDGERNERARDVRRHLGWR